MRALSVVCLAILISACGVPAPTSPTIERPKAGVAATIELTATSGIGAAGGKATVQARVLDPYFKLLPNIDITFATDVGTLTPVIAQTDDSGIATTVLAAPAGLVKVTASAGSVTTPALSISIQPLR